jgi:hypothetical protein
LHSQAKLSAIARRLNERQGKSGPSAKFISTAETVIETFKAKPKGGSPRKPRQMAVDA